MRFNSPRATHVWAVALSAWIISGSLALAADASSPTNSPAIADPYDWPNWRGPEQNGVSRETGLIDRWTLTGDPATSHILWKRDDLGSISTPIILRGKLYLALRDQPDTPKEREKVVCVDPATGKTIWEHLANVYLSDVPAERVGWSSCAGDPATGRIYVQGAGGFFRCLDGATGKVVWSRSMSEEFGALTTYGGRTNIPVIFDDLVIISAVMTGWGDLAKPAHRFLAMKKDTGETVWLAGTNPFPEDTTYSTPFLTTLKGQAAMVFGAGDGAVYAIQPRTGVKIWSYKLSRRGLNVSPIVEKEVVYTAHGEENADNSMGAIVAIDGAQRGDITKTGLVWPRAEGLVGKSSPLLAGGRLYCVDDGGKMAVLDAKTGEEVCPPVRLTGTIMKSSPIFGDGKIYVCTTTAWHTFEPTENGVKALFKMRLKEDDDISGSPIISHGRIYLPSVARLYCLGDPNASQTPPPSVPAKPVETPVGKDDKPVTLQLTPVESLIAPGAKQTFTVRLFNDRGQFLRTSPAEFELAGPGAIDSKGVYSAAADAAHTTTVVMANAGGLTAQARIRVVPPLPWKFDFNNDEVPATWIGARFRYVPRETVGEKILAKVTTIPKGARSQSWFGPTNLHDYTIQADVRGVSTNGRLPDIGLIAQRYTFDLMGASQQLQIRSWTPQLRRFSRTEPFEWKGDIWYTMKFQASVENGTAVLKGKVWPRGDKEPAEWAVEAVDETSNVEGSPGLFGNANEAEILYDNVLVTPNGASKP